MRRGSPALANWHGEFDDMALCLTENFGLGHVKVPQYKGQGDRTTYLGLVAAKDANLLELDDSTTRFIGAGIYK